jgi:hypothetical protein
LRQGSSTSCCHCFRSINDYQALGDILGAAVIDIAAERAADIVDDPEELCEVLADKFASSASA